MTSARKLGLAAAGLLAALAIGAPASAETTLNYGSYVTARHNMHTKSLEPWFRQVEADTNGSVKFKLFSDGTMVSGRSALPGIRDGVVDMGLIVDLYFASELKSSTLMSELALFGENTMAMTGVVNEMQLLHCPSCLSDLARNNIKPLGFYASTPYRLLCRSEVGDLKSLRGKRIRATGAWAGWVNAIGAVPVNVTSTESYEALERGQIDCSLGPTAFLTSLALMDVVKYVIELPLGTYHGANAFNMNTAVWEKRSAAEKASMRKHLPQAVSNLAVGYDDEDNVAREQAKAKGVKFVPPGEDLKAMVIEYRQNEVKRVVELGKRRGVDNTDQLAATFVGLVDKWTKIVNDIDGDPKRFAEALETHVYSKLKD